MPIDNRWFLLPFVVSLGIGVLSFVEDNLLTGIASLFLAVVCLVRAFYRDKEIRPNGTGEHPKH